MIVGLDRVAGQPGRDAALEQPESEEPDERHHDETGHEARGAASGGGSRTPYRARISSVHGTGIGHRHTRLHDAATLVPAGRAEARRLTWQREAGRPRRLLQARASSRTSTPRCSRHRCVVLAVPLRGRRAGAAHAVDGPPPSSRPGEPRLRTRPEAGRARAGDDTSAQTDGALGARPAAMTGPPATGSAGVPPADRWSPCCCASSPRVGSGSGPTARWTTRSRTPPSWRWSDLDPRTAYSRDARLGDRALRPGPPDPGRALDSGRASPGRGS